GDRHALGKTQSGAFAVHVGGAQRFQVDGLGGADVTPHQGGGQGEHDDGVAQHGPHLVRSAWHCTHSSCLGSKCARCALGVPCVRWQLLQSSVRFLFRWSTTLSPMGWVECVFQSWHLPHTSNWSAPASSGVASDACGSWQVTHSPDSTGGCLTSEASCRFTASWWQ